MMQLKAISKAAKASTTKLEQHVHATNAQIAGTLQELQNATTLLSTQVATITTELAGVAALLKSMQDKIDNVETNRIAPASKALRTDAVVAPSH